MKITYETSYFGTELVLRVYFHYANSNGVEIKLPIDVEYGERFYISSPWLDVPCAYVSLKQMIYPGFLKKFMGLDDERQVVRALKKFSDKYENLIRKN